MTRRYRVSVLTSLPRESCWRIDDPTLPRDGLRPWFGVAGCLIPGVTQRSGDEVSTVTRSVGSTLSPQI